MSNFNIITVGQLSLQQPLPGYPGERWIYGVSIDDTVLFYCVQNTINGGSHYLPPDYKFPGGYPQLCTRASGYRTIDEVLHVLYSNYITSDEIKLLQNARMLVSL